MEYDGDDKLIECSGADHLDWYHSDNRIIELNFNQIFIRKKRMWINFCYLLCSRDLLN